MAISEHGLNTLKKIDQLEQNGQFDVDPWQNPEFKPLKQDQVDYFRKKLSTKISNKLCNTAVERFVKKMEKSHQAILTDITGLEKLSGLTSGAVITSNHFHPFDSYPISKMVKSQYGKSKTLNILVAEHNYAGGKGFYGRVFRHQNTIPLAQDKRVLATCLKAVNYYLKKGDLVLVYPEQALWFNYKKPRPLKSGAFKFAVRANVPVIACFVTMRDSQYLDADGFAVQEYTLHILDVLYAKSDLSEKENVEYLKQTTEQKMREKYEQVYGKKLTYTKEDNE